MTRTHVLDHGYVELVGSMGSDLDIVVGARQSFDEMSHLHFRCCPEVELSHEKKWRECECLGHPQLSHHAKHLAKKDDGLINFLMRQRHTSPFELVTVKFAVQLPIFVAREWMRHRTQSFNEMSGRYTQLSRLFYVPARDDIREQTGKPGAYTYERMESDHDAEMYREMILDASNGAFNSYELMVDDGVAKEVARLVLPVNTYTKFVASANLLNWMRFLSLRNHPDAQLEIRVYAEAIEAMLHEVAPVAMEKFVEHGRLGQ